MRIEEVPSASKVVFDLYHELFGILINSTDSNIKKLAKEMSVTVGTPIEKCPYGINKFLEKLTLLADKKVLRKKEDLQMLGNMIFG